MFVPSSVYAASLGAASRRVEQATAPVSVAAPRVLAHAPAEKKIAMYSRVGLGSTGFGFACMCGACVPQSGHRRQKLVPRAGLP